MLHHNFLQPEGILILEPDSALEAADFENLARELDPYLDGIGIRGRPAMVKMTEA